MSIFNTKEKRLLLVEIGFFEAKVSLLARKKDRLELLDEAAAKQINLADALDHCLQQLKQRNKRLPKSTVIVSREVVAGWLNLSIPSNLTDSQIREMLRWELDGNFDSFASAPAVNDLLRVSGYLDSEAKAQLLGKDQSGAGDLLQSALQHGILCSEEIEGMRACLDDWPRSSEDYTLAWVSGQQRLPSDYVLVSALPERFAGEWIDYFKERKFRLLGTLAAPLLSYAVVQPKLIAAHSHAMVESDLHQIYGSYFTGGNLVDPASYSLVDDGIPEDLIEDLIIHEVQTVTLIDTNFGIEELNIKLTEAGYTGEVRIIDPELEGRTLPVVALEAIMRGSAQIPVPELVTKTQLTPLYHQPSPYWLVAGFLGIIFCLFFSMNRSNTAQALESELEIITAKLDSVEVARKERAFELKRSKELSVDTRAAEQALSVAQISVGQHDTAAFYLGILEGLSVSLRDEVSLKHMSIDNRARVAMSGLSFTDHAVREVLKGFYQEVSPWAIIPQVTEIRANNGTGAPFTFSVIPK